MAILTYRDAVARGIAQEMERDEMVVLIGEDVAGAGGVFKTTTGLLERFGPERVIDTPISEQAILGAAMGAAMTGMRPIAEIMFSDFFAVCWDLVVNEMAKTRYMTNGQVTIPLVVKSGNGGSLRFGAQHSQSIENWAMAVPGHQGRGPVDSRGRGGSDGRGRPQRRPGALLRAQGALLVQGRGPRRSDRGRARHGEGASSGQGRDGGRARPDGEPSPHCRRAARRAGHRLRGHRHALAGAARRRDRARVARPDGTAVHRGGEPADARAGAPSWSPSPATTASGTSTDRSSASPRRTSRWPPPTRSRT